MIFGKNFRPTLTVRVTPLNLYSDYVDKIVLVSEQDLCVAILRLIENEKIVVEGSGAIGVAALMSGKVFEKL